MNLPPGIHRIELPLPFELESVNVFLVRLTQGYLLIDCGLNTEPAFLAFESGMQALGLQWTDIRQILLTHMHPDHMGMSAKLLQLTGATLMMHETEARHLALLTKSDCRLPWLDHTFTEAGMPQDVQARIDRHFTQIRSNFHSLIPDRLLAGGEVIPTAIGGLQVLWTPGHSPGHVCLYCAEHKLLFSGDLILKEITPNIAWLPERDTLADFLASLDSLVKVEIELIVPSHGKPFQGHREWIGQTTDHHRDRCDEIHGLLATTPDNAYALVGKLWTRTLSPINHHFAVLEVLAHLEYMQRRGRLHSGRHDGSVRWNVSTG